MIISSNFTRILRFSSQIARRRNLETIVALRLRAFSSNSNNDFPQSSTSLSNVSNNNFLQQNQRSNPQSSLILQHIQKSPDIWNAIEILESVGVDSNSRKSNLMVQIQENEVEALINRLFELVRDCKSDSIKKEILNSVGFQKFCQLLRHHSRWLDSGGLITSVKLLTYLGAPGTNSTLQIVLRILSKITNQLNCQELIYLNFLLYKSQGRRAGAGDDNLVPGAAGATGTGGPGIMSALQLALPIVFESQILGNSWTQSITNDPNLLVDCLTFSVRYNLNIKVIEKILGWISHAQAHQAFNPRQSMMILWALLDMKRGPGAESELNLDQIMANCLTKVNPNIHEFSTDDLSTVVSKFSRKYPHLKGKSKEFVCSIGGLDDLLDLYCQRLVEPRQREEHVLYSLRFMSILRHLNIEILDHAAGTILQKPGTLLNNESIFYGTIRCYSNFNYKPPGWDKLKVIMLNHPVLTKELVPQSIPFIVDLLTLDIFPKDWITKLFSIGFHTRLVQYTEKYSPSALVMILNAIKTLYADEYGNGPLPPQSMVDSWYSSLLKIPKIYELKQSLISGIGGENYVMSGLYCNGFHIDHAIVMRKGGYPVALDLTHEPLIYSDVKAILPPESDIVLIKAYFDESYANNTPRLRGINAFELRLIETLGHPVIPISVPKWKELGHHERIPYLMERVRDKLSTVSQ